MQSVTISDSPDSNETELTISTTPEQMERLQHIADNARVSLARSMREGTKLPAAEVVQDGKGTWFPALAGEFAGEGNSGNANAIGK